MTADRWMSSLSCSSENCRSPGTSAAIIVAGHHRPGEEIHRLEEAGIGAMGGIENHSEAIEFLQQLHATASERSVVARAHGIMAFAIVGQADGAEPVVPPLLGLRRGNDRVSPFHGEDDSDRQFGICITSVIRPSRPVGLQLLPIFDEVQLLPLCKQAVIAQLAAGDGTRDLLRGDVEIDFADRLRLRFGTAEQGAAANGGAAAAHFGESHGSVPTGIVVGHSGLDGTQRGDGLSEVPIPGEGIPGKIEMGIDDEPH